MVVLYNKFDTTLFREKFIEVLQTFPENLREEIMQVESEEKKICKLIGKVLLREGLKYYKAKGIEGIEKGKNNKPFIPNAPHFNISHSGSYVVCAMSDAEELGIDIEKVRPIDINNLEKILSPQDLEVLDASNNREDTFFSIWAKKEAALKADGMGIIPSYLKKVIIQEDKAYINKENIWNLKEIEIDNQYKTFLATRTPNPQVKIERFDFV